MTNLHTQLVVCPEAPIPQTSVLDDCRYAGALEETYVVVLGIKLNEVVISGLTVYLRLNL